MVEGLLLTPSFYTVIKYGINCGLGSCKNMSLSLEACIVECWNGSFPSRFIQILKAIDLMLWILDGLCWLSLRLGRYTFFYLLLFKKYFITYVFFDGLIRSWVDLCEGIISTSCFIMFLDSVSYIPNNSWTCGFLYQYA